MKNEKRVNYTADINHLLDVHHKQISEKIVKLLVLLLIQTPDVQKQMVERYLESDFSFVFSKLQKQYTPEFKQTVRQILKEAMTDGFDLIDAERLIFGYVLNVIPSVEFRKLAFTHSFRDYKTLPEEN